MKIPVILFCLGAQLQLLRAELPARPLLGILQHREEHLQQNYQAGARIVVIELGWDRAEPESGHFNHDYFEQIRTSMRLCKSEGFQLSLDLGIQYPPEWIFDLPHSRFVNQFGQAFQSETLGENIANAVFNQNIREHQERYIQQVMKQLGSDFRLIRLGWMKYGELAFPLHRFQTQNNCYWSFDEIARGKVTGLPPGIPVCPTGIWLPGDPDPESQMAETFLNWYIHALQDYHDWQIHTLRKYTNAPLAMLYPSWGLRPGDRQKAVDTHLSGKSPRESTGEIQRGLDFQQFISGIKDPRVVVYCTWLDSSPDFSRDESPDPVHWSPSHYLAHLAANHHPQLEAWAENTGGGPPEVFDLCLKRIQHYGYTGFLWAFEPDLYNGTPPELQDFKAFADRLTTQPK